MEEETNGPRKYEGLVVPPYSFLAAYESAANLFHPTRGRLEALAGTGRKRK